LTDSERAEADAELRALHGRPIARALEYAAGSHTLADIETAVARGECLGFSPALYWIAAIAFAVISIAAGATLTTGSTSLLVASDSIGDGKLVSMNAVGLPSLLGEQAHATHRIYGAGAGFQMGRITTWFVPAQMVDSQARRNRSDQKFVNESMRVSRFSIVTTQQRIAISRVALDLRPNPTFGVAATTSCQLGEESQASTLSFEDMHSGKVT
jgi:hypothetical protein